MRTRNIKLFFDTFMWYLLYLLPIFVLLFMIAKNGQLVTFDTVFTGLGLEVFNNNVILTSLIDIFGQNGVFPLFTSYGILTYASYFVCVYLVHLAVDFLIFIPRLLENLGDKFTKNGGVKDD